MSDMVRAWLDHTRRGTTYADTETTAHVCDTCGHKWTETR